jgi:hypothetical protein
MATQPGAIVGDGKEIPATIEQAFRGFAHTAIGGGYIRVFVDGVEVSKHTHQHKAAQAAEAAKQSNPAARVTYRPEYEIEVTHL